MEEKSEWEEVEEMMKPSYRRWSQEDIGRVWMSYEKRI